MGDKAQSGSAISVDETRALARLARLALSDDELMRFAGQLDRILDYIHVLKSADLTGVEEWQPGDQPHSSLRADDPTEPLDVERALANAPKRRGRLVVVPKFKED